MLPQSFLARIGTFEAGYLAARYGIGAVVLAESLILAYILPATTYGEIAFLNQLVTLVACVGLGSTTGYVLLKYRGEEASLLEAYPLFATAHYVLLAGLTGAVLWAAGSSYSVSFLLFLLSLPFYVYEPLLRVRRKFVQASLNKGLVSACSVLLFALPFAAIGYVPDRQVAIRLLVAANLAAFALFLWFIRDTIRRQHFFLPRLTSGKGWRSYFYLIREGFPVNLASILYAAFYYLDRFFIAAYYPGEVLGVYALALNMSMLVVLGLASLNYVNGVNIGEALSRDPAHQSRLMTRQLRTAVVMGVTGSLVVVAVAAALGHTVYARYRHLPVVVALLLLGQVAFQAQAAVSPLLMFKRRQWFLTACYGAVLLLATACDLLIARSGWSYLWMLTTSAGLFVVASTVVTVAAFRSIRAHAPVQLPAELSNNVTV
ncbi:MAG: hypothetical protein ACRD2M_04240 [Terriglobales bacterium]